MRRLVFILLLLGAMVAGPLWLRRDTAMAQAGASDDRLVIISPHNATVRREFGEAFAGYWQRKTGRSLYVDWRAPGGAAEIRRLLDSAYAAAATLGNDGVGIDVLFGGGDQEFVNQAMKGRLKPLEVFATNPEWFRAEVIPAEFTGEAYYDKDRRWTGVCLFQIGICYNRDVLARRGLPEPSRWEDLGDPGYAGALAFADPTKSGSVGKALEMIIQEQMQQAIRERGDGREAREEGWRRGLNLLQKLAANSRYFTDAASRVPYDVAQGEAAAGVCIDYYGRTFEERLERSRGVSRLHWIAPQGGSSVGVDPVAVLRGAPQPEMAQEFVRFCLSDEGQLLWNLRLGEPGGPRRVALRRLPVRRDVYTPANRERFSDGAALPYQQARGFTYRKDLTEGMTPAITALFRAMCMDPHEEMKAAWLAMKQAAGQPGEQAAAVAFFDVSPFGYERARSEWLPLFAKRDPQATLQEITRISGVFRENYRRAYALAREVSP